MRETFALTLVEDRGSWGYMEHSVDVIHDGHSRVTPDRGPAYATGAYQSPLRDCTAVPHEVACHDNGVGVGPICNDAD